MALGLVTPKGVEVFGEPQQIVLGWMERSVVLLRGGGMRGWGAEGGGQRGVLVLFRAVFTPLGPSFVGWPIGCCARKER